MGSRNKKKIFGIANKKRGKNKRSASSASSRKRRERSQDLNNHELKDMKKLWSNDEAFHLSLTRIEEIIDIIRSRKTPTFGIYKRWDEYAISFYLKMCICCGVDYQHLEATSKDDDDDDADAADADDDADDDDGKNLKQQEERMESGGLPNPFPFPPVEPLEGSDPEPLLIFRRRILSGPYEFGSYSSRTKPDRIPYHLYLLVKAAADIMNNNIRDMTDLERVEKKIWFFCNYFHPHLPNGWNYDRNNASSLITGYDTTRRPRYRMAGYTPNSSVHEPNVDYDETTLLTPPAMAEVMNIIHSRKTKILLPSSFRKMINATQLSFYCKLCSCFGLDYFCFKLASEDDVCLMNVGELPSY